MLGLGRVTLLSMLCLRNLSSAFVSKHYSNNPHALRPNTLLFATKPKPAKQTGGLRKLPVVKSPPELLSQARKTHLKVKADTSVSNVRQRARKHGAETLNALAQALCLPIRDTVNEYKFVWRNLHPFERVVADLTVTARQKKDGLQLFDVLDDLHEARKQVLEHSKDWIAKIKQSDTAKEADASRQDGIRSLMELFEAEATTGLVNLLDLQKSLRSAPIVELDKPAIVLVGAPNVGKSSIVRAISSATPEISNYPFTTRGMTLGHVEVFWDDSYGISKATIPQSRKHAFSELCQVMDSPGLLVRDDADRNEMELLTLASLQHLPTAVCFVLDLTGNAGDKCSSIEDQLAIRQSLRERFPKRPWIDVVSKIDLGVDEAAVQELGHMIAAEEGIGYIELSVHEGTGVPELRAAILRMLGEVRVVLDAMAAVEQQEKKERDQKSTDPASG